MRTLTALLSFLCLTLTANSSQADYRLAPRSGHICEYQYLLDKSTMTVNGNLICLNPYGYDLLIRSNFNGSPLRRLESSDGPAHHPLSFRVSNRELDAGTLVLKERPIG